MSSEEEPQVEKSGLIIQDERVRSQTYKVIKLLSPMPFSFIDVDSIKL